MERAPELVGPHELSELEKHAVLLCLAAGEPLVDENQFNALVAGLGRAALDPYRSVVALARSSRLKAALLRTDLGLPWLRRQHEHVQGVLGGGERDLVPLFSTAPLRRILRLTWLLQDGGKSLCVAVEKTNVAQAVYNVSVADNLLATLRRATLPPVERKAVRLLLGQDIIGNALQGRFDHRELDRLRRNWPWQLAMQRDDLLLAAYLADAGAHTRHRQYRDPDSLQLWPCIPADQEGLTGLFKPDAHGRLALCTPAHRRIVRALLPVLGAVSPLAPSHDHVAASPPPFKQVAAADGAWSAVLRLDPMRLAELRTRLLDFAQRNGSSISGYVFTRWGAANTLVLLRDPGLGVPSIGDCEHAAQQLAYELGARRDLSARLHAGCQVALGLKRTRTVTHAPYEALAVLLDAAPSWRTEPARLIAAVRGHDSQWRWHEEPGIVISGESAQVPAIVTAAHELGQRRLVVTDADADRTYALRRVAD